MGATTKVFRLNNFSGGIDLREGRFAENQNRFRDLVNYRVTNVKRLSRRPPLLKLGGTFANCQGLLQLRGALYTIAKKGDVVTVPSGVTTTAVWFDNPDYCTTWTLLDATVFNGALVALIRHAFLGSTVTSRIMLHVFDGKANKPTYVEDPACPTHCPSFPTHLYGTGTPGTFSATFVPRLAVAGGRLYISRPDGNTGFSKTGNARVWNSRTATDLLSGGEWYDFLIPTGASLREFVVSEVFSTLAQEPGWSGYLLEYLDATGVWRLMTEDAAAPTVDKHWRPQSVASRFAGGPNEIKVQVYWTGAADAMIRLRLIAGGPVTKVVTGCGLAEALPYELFAGTGAAVAFTSTEITAAWYGAIPVPSQPNYFQVRVGGVIKTAGVDYTVGSTVVAGIAMLQVTFTVAPALNASILFSIRGGILLNANPLPKTYDLAGNPTVSAGTMSRDGVAVQVAVSTNPEVTLGPPLDITVSGQYLMSVHLISMTPMVMWGAYVLATPYVPGTFPSPQGTSRFTGVFTKILTYDATLGYFTASETYYYGNEAGHESAFYLARKVLYETELAGSLDAGYLPTSSQAIAGGAMVTSLAAIKDRLLVFYSSGCELWLVNGDVTTHRLLDSGPVGTGAQAEPSPTKVLGAVVIAAARGLRAVTLDGSNLDSMRDQNLGEPIVALGTPACMAAVYWPWLGEYLAAVTISGAFQLLVLDHSPESKVSAWSRWTFAGLATVDPHAMQALDDRLYIRVGSALYYLDASATSFRDSNDAAGDGNAYGSLGRWHFNDFQKPGVRKKVVGADLVQTGTCTLAFQEVLHDESIETVPIPISGPTYSYGKIPVVANGPGIAPVIRSTDETGHELQELSLTFAYQGR